MTPDVTRAAEEYANQLGEVLYPKPTTGMVCGMRMQYEASVARVFREGAKWKSEQHRELLIRLKHILERHYAHIQSDERFSAAGAIHEAVTLINKELAT
jgi:hypothetical protein